MIQTSATARLSGEVLGQIRALLDEAFDGDFADEDFEHTLGGTHVVLFAGTRERLVAHAAVVPRDLVVAGRTFSVGYVEGVAVAADVQRQGHGSTVMGEIDALIRRDFAIGALSSSRTAFYERLGWERWQGPTYVHDGASVMRTPDEDDGILVLRFGPSDDADLHASISCDARIGDAW